MHGGWWVVIFLVGYLPFRWLSAAVIPQSVPLNVRLVVSLAPDFVFSAICIAGYFATRKPKPTRTLDVSDKSQSNAADLDVWFFDSGGGPDGPHSANDLRGFARSGRIGPNTMVWRNGRYPGVAKSINFLHLIFSEEAKPIALPGAKIKVHHLGKTPSFDNPLYFDYWLFSGGDTYKIEETEIGAGISLVEAEKYADAGEVFEWLT